MNWMQSSEDIGPRNRGRHVVAVATAAMIAVAALPVAVHGQTLDRTLEELRSDQDSTRLRAIQDLLRLGGTNDTVSFGSRMNALMAKFAADRPRIVDAVCLALTQDNARDGGIALDALSGPRRFYTLRLFSIANAFGSFGEV